jgi:hypothetical protein
MDKVPFWDHERSPMSAEEYNAFWGLVDYNYTSDWEWTQLAWNEKALSGND